jgi:hypothetical protein
MKVVVFAGPTIDAATIGSFIDCTVRGPVTFGDVYRAAKYRPTAIVLIDGYFERVPAVWHKEILWAMSEGVHVFGCSSMGALRAAELADFGMVGVGEIFEAYRSGELEDDDEVAVAHRSAEDAYAPTSDALVNIRATLKRAVREDVVTEATAGALLRVAKERSTSSEATKLSCDTLTAWGLIRESSTHYRAGFPRALWTKRGSTRSRCSVTSKDGARNLESLCGSGSRFTQPTPGAKPHAWREPGTTRLDLGRRLSRRSSKN